MPVPKDLLRLWSACFQKKEFSYKKDALHLIATIILVQDVLRISRQRTNGFMDWRQVAPT